MADILTDSTVREIPPVRAVPVTVEDLQVTEADQQDQAVENERLEIQRLFREVLPLEMLRLEIPVILTIMIIGMVGVGKTTLFKLLCGIINGGRMRWMSDTKDVKLADYSVNGFVMHVFDIEGAVGNRKKDVFIMHRVCNLINQEHNTINRILWVMTPDRVQCAQHDYLDMIINGVSEEALSIVHVVITRVDEREVTAEFRREVAENLSFLGDTDEEVFRRVTFMNLINPVIFEEGTILRREIENRWSVQQRNLLKVITHNWNATPTDIKRVPMSKFFRYSFLVRVAFSYWMEISFFLMLCIVLYYLHKYLLYFDLNQKALDDVNLCLAKNRDLMRQLQDNATNTEPVPTTNIFMGVYRGLLNLFSIVSKI